MNVSPTGAHGAGAGEPCPRSGLTGSELGLLYEGKTAYADAAVRGRRETQPVRSGWTRRWLQQAYLRAAGRGLCPRVSRWWRARSRRSSFTSRCGQFVHVWRLALHLTRGDLHRHGFPPEPAVLFWLSFPLAGQGEALPGPMGPGMHCDALICQRRRKFDRLSQIWK